MFWIKAGFCHSNFQPSVRGYEMRFSHDSAEHGVCEPADLLFSVPAAVLGVNGTNRCLICVTGACLNNRLIVLAKWILL